MFDDIFDDATGRGLVTEFLSIIPTLFRSPFSIFRVNIFQPSYTVFTVSLGTGKSAREIRRALDGAGAPYWGLAYDADGFQTMFNVNRGDEQKAHAALTAAGIPVIYPRLEGER